MAEGLLEVDFTYDAHWQFDTLGSDSKRIISNCLEGLRHWHADESVRARARRLQATEEELYLIDTGLGYVIYFVIDGSKIIVQAIFRKETLERFHGKREQAVA